MKLTLPTHRARYLSSLRLSLLIVFSIATNILSAQSDSLFSAASLKQLSLEELMNVEVTSVSKTPEKLSAVASAVQVITAEDIRRAGISTLPEALKLASNVQIAKVNSSQWAISVRGFNNVLADKLLIMIDGRTVYTPLYAGTYWDVQNVMLEDIDRIEVISGPGGTLWGANAVNGVINIITKSSKDTQGLFAQIGAGTLTPWSADVRYGGKINDKLHYRVYGMGFKQASTKLTNGKKANDAWSIGQGGFRFDWDASEKDQVTLQSDFYDGFPNPDGATPVVVLGGNVLGRWTRTISEKSDFSIQTYYDQTFRDLLNGFKEKLKTFDVDWQYRFQAGNRNEFIWGGDLRLMKDQMQNLELFAFEPADKNLHIYSTFLQDKLTLVPSRLFLTAGLKVEHNSYTGFEYSPSVHLSWAAAERHTLWAGVSRAVRTPSRIDEDFTLSLAPGVPLIKASDFRSETLIAYEVGWRTQPLESLSLSVGTFFNDYDNIRSVMPGPPPTGFPLTFKNDVEGHSYGIELSATYQPTDWWRMRGGYTFLKKKLRIKPGGADGNNASAESDDPENQFVIQSMFDIKKHIGAGFVFRYVSILPLADVPAYAGLDVQVGVDITKNVMLSVIGQNLLDDRHPEFIPSSPSSREILRGINAKLTCRF
jgi:iron complex outermembrane receptor protein